MKEQHKYEKIKSMIESKEYEYTNEARMAISAALVKRQITNEEHASLRFLLNALYE